MTCQTGRLGRKKKTVHQKGKVVVLFKKKKKKKGGSTPWPQGGEKTSLATGEAGGSRVWRRTTGPQGPKGNPFLEREKRNTRRSEITGGGRVVCLSEGKGLPDGGKRTRMKPNGKADRSKGRERRRSKKGIITSRADTGRWPC